MVIISIDTVGTERFVRGFNRYVAEMKDFGPAFEQVGEYFYKTEEKIFAKQGDPKKFSPPPLSDKYRAWKKKHYPAATKIMQLTGRLMASLTGTDQANLLDTVRKIGKTKAEFGSKVPYVHRHQEGTFGMPKRKIVQQTEPRNRAIAKIIQTWSLEELQKSIGFHDRQIGAR